jgi:hypothetical protein
MDLLPVFLILPAFLALALWLWRRSRRKKALRAILLDGSNILYWGGDRPELPPLISLIRGLERSGHYPVVWFDANAGYLIEGRYMGPAHLAPRLGVTAGQVFVAPKGTPADPLILAAARSIGANIITNDRYRDWTADYPEVSERGLLIRGSIGQDGVLTLGLQQAAR